MDRLTVEERVKIIKCYYKNETGSVTDIVSPGHDRNIRSAEHITVRILQLDLKLHPCKVQLTHELKPRDHGQRRSHATWVIEQQAAEIIAERPLHPEKVTVWCALWSGGRYRRVLTGIFRETLNIMIRKTCGSSRTGNEAPSTGVRELLQQKFPGCVISRLSDVNWPARSCNLTPLHFILWGYAKDRVYANNTQTLEQLKANICEVMTEMLPYVNFNFIKRLRFCQECQCVQFEELLMS
ncbi:hypothetical protein YQE_09896, partial [Dendroctonus ponderosae]